MSGRRVLLLLFLPQCFPSCVEARAQFSNAILYEEFNVGCRLCVAWRSGALACMCCSKLRGHCEAAFFSPVSISFSAMVALPQLGEIDGSFVQDKGVAGVESPCGRNTVTTVPTRHHQCYRFVLCQLRRRKVSSSSDFTIFNFFQCFDGLGAFSDGTICL